MSLFGDRLSTETTKLDLGHEGESEPYVTGVLTKGENLDTETCVGEYDVRRHGEKAASTIQGEGPGTDFSLTASKRSQRCRHLNFRISKFLFGTPPSLWYLC